jgi:L-threonylcarbamoyladenylate synthase
MLHKNKKLIKVLKEGGTAVIPTDTIYGLSVLALQHKSVEKIYRLKKRDSKKSMLILISDISQLKLFGARIDDRTKKFLNKIWPGKVSVAIPCDRPEFRYLHRGHETPAFRLPKRADLIKLIKITGPLISTSANPEKSAPALTIEEAKNYFGGNVDIYVDEGKLESLPSTLISIIGGKVEVLRQGAVNLSDLKISKIL